MADQFTFNGMTQGQYEAEFTQKLHYHNIPPYMHQSVMDWVFWGHRRHVDEFLEAFLQNDLRRTFEQADDVNRRQVLNYIKFFYNEAPSDCWGSIYKFTNWKGLMPE